MQQLLPVLAVAVLVVIAGIVIVLLRQPTPTHIQEIKLLSYWDAFNALRSIHMKLGLMQPVIWQEWLHASKGQQDVLIEDLQNGAVIQVMGGNGILRVNFQAPNRVVVIAGAQVVHNLKEFYI